ncbi:spore germination protein [Halalkalibacterium ligniniphilum]|uniref:spore germination protein n=2 Tax=Halalkalibacterium ligniniphilum TaxID=1134413 RepID=UPI00034B5FC4|nr:spore germination protein [Halalkalibacterium ligniniphilum]
MFFWNRYLKKEDNKKNNQSSQESSSDTVKRSLHRQLKENLNNLKQELGNSPDMIIREFELGNDQLQVAIVYTDGLADKEIVNNFVMRSLMFEAAEETFTNLSSHKSIFEFIKNNALTIGEVKVIKEWNDLVLTILSGDTVILFDGFVEAISGTTKGGETRGIEEPSSQVVIRGPKDGFSESIGTNVSLIRRRIKNPKLRLEMMQIGDVTQTDVAVMYIDGVANEKIVDEVRKRLREITIDGVLESGYIEELIQDQTFTPFPTVYNTERPDSASANLLEGRIVIIVDGTPFVLIAPTNFFMFLQSSEDYYQRFDISIAIRFLRYLAFFIALFGPSVYIAVTTFHQGMIPTPLLISLAAQREGVPFPAFVEVLLMEISFEILREAGIRMPRAIGQAVSIVGGLVLGQAAVEAGLVSSALVIVVAITGISSFATPAYNMAISVRLFRFIIMIFAATFGFYGIAIVTLMITAHLCALRSFGIPYMAPLAPFILSDQKDTVLRLPIWTFRTRPRLINQKNLVRNGERKQPSPSKGKKGNQDEN